MSGSPESTEHEERHELLMRKDGDTVQMSVIVDGEQVFFAAPTVGRSSQTMRAALQTFVSQAFNGELDDANTEGAFQ